MFVLRPIRESDLAHLLALANSIDGGLTTLPSDETFLQERIDESLRAFNPKIRKPGGEAYLFVLEDTLTGTLVGTCGLVARVGGFDPFYSYEIRPERHAHPPLKVEKQFEVLHLKKTHRGPTEIGSLFLRGDSRRGGYGRLLSLARFLFIGAYPKRFDTTVIAEMRGYLDQQGKSPFWEAVGRHFFDYDFYEADFLSGLGNKEFIADLMPAHPIYLTLLPPAVQAVVGKVHHDTLPALRLLQAEGFASTNEVDIFDAGPQVRVATADIRTLRQRRTGPVTAITDAEPATPPQLVANDRLDFRATVAAVAEHDGTFTVSAPTAIALGIQIGDTLSTSPLR